VSSGFRPGGDRFYVAVPGALTLIRNRRRIEELTESRYTLAGYRGYEAIPSTICILGKRDERLSLRLGAGDIAL
jgi:hypothetical protein